MQYLFTLSKENIELSKKEAMALLGFKSMQMEHNYLVFNEINPLYKRLAYTKIIHRIIFKCKREKLYSRIERSRFDEIDGIEYSISLVNGKDANLKEIAAKIYAKLKKPKINLKNPKFSLEFVFIGKEVYCCEKIFDNKEDFNSRKAHRRPELHPTSLHPKLARCCINLTGIKKGTIVDPFCGSGGILIEAGLMGLKPKGYDIDEIMLKRAEINLRHYGINNFILKNKDATDISEKIAYVVCDLPYGKNTKQKKNIELYEKFIENMKKTLVKKAVVIYPHWIELEKMVNQTGLFIEKIFSVRIHKSLTRKIIIINKTDPD